MAHIELLRGGLSGCCSGVINFTFTCACFTVYHPFLEKCKRFPTSKLLQNLRWKRIQSTEKPSKTLSPNEEWTHVTIFRASANDLNVNRHVVYELKVRYCTPTLWSMHVLSYLEPSLLRDFHVTVFVLTQSKPGFTHAPRVQRPFRSTILSMGKCKSFLTGRHWSH